MVSVNDRTAAVASARPTPFFYSSQAETKGYEKSHRSLVRCPAADWRVGGLVDPPLFDRTLCVSGDYGWHQPGVAGFYVAKQTRHMKKSDESRDPRSCWNKAKDDELLFVLLARDPAAAATVRFWVAERVRLGKNQHGDPQTTTALNWADEVELAAKVEFCNWCPDPNHPSPEHHPNGQAAHVEVKL